MPKDRTRKDNVIKYNDKNKSLGSGKESKGKGKASPGRRRSGGIVPKIQYRLRKAYITYRRKKAAFKKNYDFADILSNRSLINAGICIGTFIVLVFVIWIFTNKNSYEVFLGEKSIGIIAMNKNVTKEVLYDSAIAKLSAELGSNVRVTEQVSFAPVHSSKNKRSPVDYVVSEISKNFTYQIEACVISVDEIDIVTLKSQSEADELLNSIIKSHEPNETVDSGFVEKVETTRIYVDSSEISSRELAYSKLTAQNTTEQQYTAKSGENFWIIASKNGMKTDDLIALNPEVSDPTKLKVGQTLTVVKTVPLLSVRVVVEEKVSEVDVKKEEKIENSEQPTSYQKVIQQGKDGEKEVTYHVTKVNGVETERKAFSERTVTASEPYIVEVGTKRQ